MGHAEVSHGNAGGGGEPVRSLDVVIATRNRPEDLERLVDSLAQLRWPDLDVAIYVIDQSDPAHVERNRRATARLQADGDVARVVHVVHDERGKSRALNHALRLSHGEVIAFTDDDCTLPGDWPAPALAALCSEPDVGIVFGRVVPIEHDPELVFIPAIEFASAATVTGPTMRSHGLLGMGANMVIRRSVLGEIGGFDEDLGPGGELFTGEECELALRALQHGHSIRQEPALVLEHWGARPVAESVARQLVLVSFFAIGAGYGKHIREGDWRVLLVLLHEVWCNLAEVAGNIRAGRRPLHLRRLVYLLRGTAAGFRTGRSAPTVTSG